MGVIKNLFSVEFKLYGNYCLNHYPNTLLFKYWFNPSIKINNDNNIDFFIKKFSSTNTCFIS